MRIIEETKIKKCCSCNTKFEYSTDDIELTWISRAAFVRCPVCGQKLFQI